MMGLGMILRMMKPLLPGISSKVANAMKERDKQMGSKNVAYIITKTENKDKQMVSSLSYIDIQEFTKDENGDVFLRAKYIKRTDGSLEVYGIGQLFENITGNESDAE